MLRIAFVVLAAAWLGACASLPAPIVAGVAPSASFDDAAQEEAARPRSHEADCACDTDIASAPVATDNHAGLERRLFSPPSRRQPDQRLIVVTALDRARRHARRRRRQAWPRHERRERTAERRQKSAIVA